MHFPRPDSRGDLLLQLLTPELISRHSAATANETEKTHIDGETALTTVAMTTTTAGDATPEMLAIAAAHARVTDRAADLGPRTAGAYVAAMIEATATIAGETPRMTDLGTGEREQLTPVR